MLVHFTCLKNNINRYTSVIDVYLLNKNDYIMTN